MDAEELNLHEIVPHVKSLVSLEAVLYCKGYRFHNLKDYIGWIEKKWLEEAKDDLEAILHNPVEDTQVFPHRELTNNGSSYRLFGLVHGQKIFYAPGFHPRKKMKQALKNYLELTGETRAFSEQGIAELFGLDSVDMKDHTLGDNIYNRDISELGKELLMSLLSPAIIPLTLLTVAVTAAAAFSGYIYFSLTKVNYKNGFLPLAIKALKNHRYMKKFDEYYSASRLPEPLGWELDYLKENTRSKLGEKLFFFLPKTASSWERDIYMAKELRDHYSDGRKKDIVCGMHHIYGIEDFFKGILPDVHEMNKYIHTSKLRSYIPKRYTVFGTYVA